MKQFHLLVLLAFPCFNSTAQTGLTTLSVPPAGRYDDIHFVNDSVGWIAGGRSAGMAKIYATRDGGATWLQQFAIPQYLRSIEFVTEKIGYCGSLDSTLFKTTDGGQTWIDITASIPKRPKGICGLSIPDVSTVYGVGKYSGPAFLIKSSDGGVTWSYIDMSAYASGLVDVYFLNKNEGFVAGISNTEGGVIWHTTDGGLTWTNKFKTLVSGDYIWKIQTPDNIHFYASVAGLPFSNNGRYLQSSDRGVTWVTRSWSDTYEYIQGIGFIDTKTGWMGGDAKLFKTTDGGDHWTEEPFQAPAFNKFFKINSKIAYLSGQRAYKYNALTTGNNGNTKPDNIHFLNVSPNPVKSVIKIQSVFKHPTFAMITIYNNDGKLIAQLLNKDVKEGSRTIDYDLSKHAAGIYYIILRTNEGMIYKKTIKQ